VRRPSDSQRGNRMNTGMIGDSPISVVICTRDRGSSIVDTVASVLRDSDAGCELLVVDQSRGIDTKTSLERFRGDPRFSYLHSNEPGLSRGRNLGITQSRGEIIAFTDDDCDVPGNWIESIAEAFRIDPHVQLVFGCVVAAPHDSSRGFIPCYEIKEPFMGRVLRDKYRIDGMGACMAVRREAWSNLSGFDPYLGAGPRCARQKRTTLLFGRSSPDIGFTRLLPSRSATGAFVSTRRQLRSFSVTYMARAPCSPNTSGSAAGACCRSWPAYSGVGLSSDPGSNTAPRAGDCCASHRSAAAGGPACAYPSIAQPGTLPCCGETIDSKSKKARIQPQAAGPGPPTA